MLLVPVTPELAVKSAKRGRSRNSTHHWEDTGFMGSRHRVLKPVVFPLEWHEHDVVSQYVLSPSLVCTSLEVKGNNWTDEGIDR